MKLFHDLNDLPEAFRRGAVSIGNFDGVHRGHARLIGRLVAMAQQVQGPAVVFTFDPHPASILHPEWAPAPLCWIDLKARALARLGADAVVAYPTDRDFLQLDARAFFEQIIRERLNARALVEGPNFFFGHNRTGTIDVLGEFCREANVQLEVVDPVKIEGSTISSSRIRKLVAEGHIDRATPLLGRPYRIRGKVIRGAGRGRALGYPTVNLAQIETLLPGEGIYAGRARAEGADYPAAINIGANPTFDEATVKVEAYLIGYQGMLYEETIEVDFLARLRDIKRFGSVDQLRSQMDRDVAATCRIVEQHDS